MNAAQQTICLIDARLERDHASEHVVLTRAEYVEISEAFKAMEKRISELESDELDLTADAETALSPDNERA
jgi:hypothetical protein